MTTHTFAQDIYLTLGSIDGTCFTCGAPARRMGWLGNHHSYWLMCTASSLGAEDERYGRCNLPTLELATKRLSAEREE